MSLWKKIKHAVKHNWDELTDEAKKAAEKVEAEINRTDENLKKAYDSALKDLPVTYRQAKRLEYHSLLFVPCADDSVIFTQSLRSTQSLERLRNYLRG